jgi:epsilon-lactone hydrolase
MSREQRDAVDELLRHRRRSGAHRRGGRVDLQVWPGVPHVFQGFAAMLDEGAEALDALGAFLDARLGAAVRLRSPG